MERNRQISVENGNRLRIYQRNVIHEIVHQYQIGKGFIRFLISLYKVSRVKESQLLTISKNENIISNKLV